MSKVLDVHIGELKIAKHGEILKAILGSCVGIGVIWKEREICGLAHCLLPESPKPTAAIGARYVDQAVRSLLAMMKIKSEDVSSVEVVIVGGGNMLTQSFASQGDLVGETNFRVAMREAQKHGLRVVHSESGGSEGIKISIHSALMTFKIERIPRISESA